ncbi:ArsR/SmtB family transcription factor [Sphingomonas sp. Leaf21]|jgi:DNA-binding transcriptional ArsR family regulator|uniref:ArsR/SmtB family transcription factor n=1 Tax=Sphingomonas sp. Leaf21 TaxID=2876550 RepID=UPI001E3E4A29|nr:metalloregulator ArsR/SmtB family transcription factor [Sphingomonas sp. Leaf21]
MDPVFEALAHPTRRRILEMLRGGGLSAGAIADAFDVSRPTMSAHFAKLKAAGLIRAEQQGTTILYTLNLSVLEQVVMGFMTRLGVGEDVAEGVKSCPSDR